MFLNEFNFLVVMRNLRAEKIEQTKFFSIGRVKALLEQPQIYLAETVDDIVLNRNSLEGPPAYAMLPADEARILLPKARLKYGHSVDVNALKSRARIKKLQFERKYRDTRLLLMTNSDKMYDEGDLGGDRLEVDLNLARSLENVTLYDNNSMLRVHCRMELTSGSTLASLVLKYESRVDLFTLVGFTKDGKRYTPDLVEPSIEYLAPGIEF